MTLQEKFNAETRTEMPTAQSYDMDHEGYYSDSADYFYNYSKWLESKLERVANTEQQVQPEKPKRLRMKLHEANYPPDYVQAYIADEMDEYLGRHDEEIRQECAKEGT